MLVNTIKTMTARAFTTTRTQNKFSSSSHLTITPQQMKARRAPTPSCYDKFKDLTVLPTNKAGFSKTLTKGYYDAMWNYHLKGCDGCTTETQTVLFERLQGLKQTSLRYTLTSLNKVTGNLSIIFDTLPCNLSTSHADM